MSYFKILGLVELGLLGIHILQLITSNVDYTQSFFWWLGVHTIMIYFVFTEFYAEIEKNAESSIRSIPLKKKEDVRPGKSNETSSTEPFYKKFYNICTIDHALLYDDDEDGENSDSRESSSTRKRKV